MEKIIMYFFLIISLALIAFGIYITVVSREDVSKKQIPDWIENNIKTLKTVGPVCIGVGVFVFAGISIGIMHKMKNIDGNSSKLNFGFENTNEEMSKTNFGFLLPSKSESPKTNFGFRFY
jgi:hypothetical protein